jgi:hypothetical protein
MGYPIIHNGKLCKDLGYYYEDCDIDKAKEHLDYILTEHDKNIEEYDEKNNIVLNRYFAENEKVVEQYDLLIDNLFKNIPNTYLKYNPDTNLYEV